MLLKQGPLVANLDIHKRISLEPSGDGTHLVCVLDLKIQIGGLMRIAKPLVVRKQQL
jgi:hypothetical protein